MFKSVNGVTLHYQREGQASGQPVVFVNSLGCNQHIWDAIVPAFAPRYRLLRYDKRGHGLSDSPPGPYSIRDHSDDLLALLRHLRVEQAVVVGISVGGLIAMDLALQHPELVRGLVISDSAPRMSTPQFWEDRIQAVRSRGLADMVETILGRWFLPEYRHSHPDDYQGYCNMLARAPLEGYIGTCAALRDADLSAEVSALNIPLLALNGAGDLSPTPEQTRQWAASVPNTSVKVIDGAAHLPCIEKPEVMSAAIEQFLREELHV